MKYEKNIIFFQYPRTFNGKNAYKLKNSENTQNFWKYQTKKSLRIRFRIYLQRVWKKKRTVNKKMFAQIWKHWAGPLH